MNNNKRRIRAANRLKRKMAREALSSETANGDQPIGSTANANDDVELTFRVDPVTLLRLANELPIRKRARGRTPPG